MTTLNNERSVTRLLLDVKNNRNVFSTTIVHYSTLNKRCVISIITSFSSRIDIFTHRVTWTITIIENLMSKKTWNFNVFFVTRHYITFFTRHVLFFLQRFSKISKQAKFINEFFSFKLVNDIKFVIFQFFSRHFKFIFFHEKKIDRREFDICDFDFDVISSNRRSIFSSRFFFDFTFFFIRAIVIARMISIWIRNFAKFSHSSFAKLFSNLTEYCMIDFSSSFSKFNIFVVFVFSMFVLRFNDLNIIFFFSVLAFSESLNEKKCVFSLKI